MDDWVIKDNKLFRVFEFESFSKALGFVNKVGFLAEEANHHPDIKIFGYNKVELSLCTHDAGNKVTEKDLKLGREIGDIYGKEN